MASMHRLRNASRLSSVAASLVACLSCHRAPADVPRTDPATLDAVLEANLGFPVDTLGEVAFPATEQSIAAIAFTGSALLECRTNTPQANCDARVGQELLGVGVFALPARKKARPKLMAYRILGDTVPIWESTFVEEQPGGIVASKPAMRDVGYGDLTSEDVDGDGKPEFVLFMLGNVFTPSEGGRIVETETRYRVTILRDDLSLQFDADVGQDVFYAEDQHDRRFERLLTDDPRNLRIQWREFALGVPYEIPDRLSCKEPTHEIVLAYSAATDGYRVEKLVTLDPAQSRSEECEEGYDDTYAEPEVYDEAYDEAEAYGEE
jgi:hypothetical protein